MCACVLLCVSGVFGFGGVSGESILASLSTLPANVWEQLQRWHSRVPKGETHRHTYSSTST